MFSEVYLDEVIRICAMLDEEEIEKMVSIIYQTKINQGRVFFLGVGGSAANCSHAVNDFRKIIGIEAYAPTDNVAELTARTNDDSWESVFKSWLEGSHLNKRDILFIFSVSGGSVMNNTSINLITASQYAKSKECKIIGVVGNKNAFIKTLADAMVIVPTANTNRITPHAEEFQSIILHLLASHPELQEFETKWESQQSF